MEYAFFKTNTVHLNVTFAVNITYSLRNWWLRKTTLWNLWFILTFVSLDVENYANVAQFIRGKLDITSIFAVLHLVAKCLIHLVMQPYSFSNK